MRIMRRGWNDFREHVAWAFPWRAVIAETRRSGLRQAADAGRRCQSEENLLHQSKALELDQQRVAAIASASQAPVVTAARSLKPTIRRRAQHGLRRGAASAKRDVWDGV